MTPDAKRFMVEFTFSRSSESFTQYIAENERWLVVTS